MRRSFRFLTVLACALPLACSDTSTTPTATAPPVPRLSANPESNGSVKWQFDDWLGFSSVIWHDEALDVIAFVGTFDVVSGCAGQGPAFTASDWKGVLSGKFQDWYHTFATMPEAYIFIYDGGWDTWGICKPPIMRGTGGARITDNDQAGVAPGARAWGIMANGQVTDGDGQAYDFTGHVRGVYHPDGSYREDLFMDLTPLH